MNERETGELATNFNPKDSSLRRNLNREIDELASKLETRKTKLYPLPRGAVAQLAERRVRNAEARSSTLLCSTN